RVVAQIMARLGSRRNVVTQRGTPTLNCAHDLSRYAGVAPALPERNDRIECSKNDGLSSFDVMPYFSSPCQRMVRAYIRAQCFAGPDRRQPQGLGSLSGRRRLAAQQVGLGEEAYQPSRHECVAVGGPVASIKLRTFERDMRNALAAQEGLKP